MASTFKNAGIAVPGTDGASAELYSATGQAVIHALFISNHSNSAKAKVDVKVTVDGGSTWRHISKMAEVAMENTLVIDKPINLETGDKIRIIATMDDGSSPVCEAFASILEV